MYQKYLYFCNDVFSMPFLMDLMGYGKASQKKYNQRSSY